MVTSNIDAVYGGHVGNHARFISCDVSFVFSISIRASPCPSPPCFLLKLCVHALELLLCCPIAVQLWLCLGWKDNECVVSLEGGREGGDGWREGGREEGGR